jgi:hypothetical protein
MDTYTIEFRIEDLSLNPSDVTRLLELNPCQIRDSNNRINKRNLNALWAYDGIYFEKDSPSYEWRTLEEGLLFILDKLEPKLHLIETNFFMYKRYFWCAHFQESFDGGTVLSTQLLKRLANFNTELVVKNYYSE